MRKFIMLLLGVNMLYILSFGQGKYTISGLVTDENNQALPGAGVLVSPIKKATNTDKNGRFEINGMTLGKYTIQISFIGYQTYIDTIRVGSNMRYNAKLKVSALTLQEVVVTDKHAEKQKKEKSLNIEIVNDTYLKQNMGGSLMKSLERLPGIGTIDIGSGQSKPVIRGLGFNRVVVIENNIKHEAQQWGSDHGLEIDQYAINNIEVIKGPASLIYGSDAIGGVVDMKNRKIALDNTIGGTLDLTGKTNNDYLGASFSMNGRKNWFYADVRATISGYGDYKVPTDSVDIYSYRAALYKNHLRNTAGNEQNLHISLGILQKRFHTSLYISNVKAKTGFFANAHGLEPRNVDRNLHDKSNRDINYPYQEVNHFKVINTSTYQWSRFKIESNLGFQHNYRQEWSQYVNHGYMPAIFPDTLGFDSDLERLFDKFVYSGNLKVSFDKTDKTHISIGINTEYQDNRIDGRGFIIPAFHQLNLGAYAFAKYHLTNRSLVQAGVRYDYGKIDTRAYYDWFPSPLTVDDETIYEHLKRADKLNRNFSNISWSLGYNFNSERWLFKANAGKSFRMPIAKELAANGVNYHHFSYEVGNPGLSPEISYQLDAGIEYSSKKIAIGLSPFLNYFSNYIYLNPTAEHDRLYGNGNQVYYYTQSRVFRNGVEIHAHYQLVRPLQLGFIGEFVYSRQVSGEKEGFSLPFSPPASAIINIKFQKQRIKPFENIYLSVDYKLTARQVNIVPPEVNTPGYQLVHVSFGGDLLIKNQKINISVQIQNLLNNKYFNHTSYYRLINVPEPGRNLIVNISVPFSGLIKK